jgi:hypothetical protein
LGPVRSRRKAASGQPACPCTFPSRRWTPAGRFAPRRNAAVGSGWNPGSSGVRMGHHTPTSLVAAGRVGYFGEHRAEPSCPKCGKPCAGYDAVGGVPLAVHRVSRGGRDRLDEPCGGVDEPADPVDQADGERVAEPRMLSLCDRLPSHRAGSPSAAGFSPHDLLKRRKSAVRKVQHGI